MKSYDRIQTIADILPYWASAAPRRIALQELDRSGQLASTSFAELKGHVDAFAGRLYELGVRPGQTVALVMPNSRHWVIGYYAAFRLGAVAVPIEHGMLRTEPDRVRYTLDNAEARIVICDSEDEEQAAQVAGEQRRTLAAQRVDLASAPLSLPAQPEVKPDDLAQILYTSGTTGPRKGVELTHANIIFDVRKLCDRFGLKASDCVPALLPYHHAYPLTATVVLPLYAGARMAVGDIRDRRSRDLLRQCRPSVLVGVPRVFESLLESVRNAAARASRLESLEGAMRLSALLKRLTRINVGKLLFRSLHRELFGGLQLRFCVSGGARISPKILRECSLLGIPVVQGWGMSELSPVATVQSFWPGRFYFTNYYERKAGSIGKPLDGTRIALLQDAGEALSFDVQNRGEMAVSGPHVMRGYHKDPVRTEEQMTEQGIRSGDIARGDPDGDLYVIGRVKHVIVLPNGKKVFPEDDLEEELSQCPTIEEFAVRPISDDAGAERIGIVVRPDLEELQSRNVRTLAELYAAIKSDMDQALQGKPDYLKQYDFCLTPWSGHGYAELVKTAMGKPCPLRIPFYPETAYSRMKGSNERAPFAE